MYPKAFYYCKNFSHNFIDPIYFGNKVYIYQEREASGIYIARAYKNENKSGYVEGFPSVAAADGINNVAGYMNRKYDDSVFN